MNPACEMCKGACCESLVFPIDSESGVYSRAYEFLLTRGVPHERGLCFELRCRHLGEDGSCLIYATRPEACKSAEVGSEMCLDAVKRRRSSDGKILREIWKQLGE